MSTIEIERGVPIPKRGPRATVYPWARMQIGDSFWVATAQQGLCTLGAKITGHVYVQRRVAGPDGREGLRIWRVE